jgi:erythromycin esterase
MPAAGCRSRFDGALVVRGCASLLAFTLAACSQSASEDAKPRVAASLPARTWVDAAVPIERVEPGGDGRDLDPLRSSFAGARVIAIGEATHGSHEFFSLRERLLAWSIAQLGVRTLAIEASMAEVTELDRYIQGDGAPEQASQLVARSSNWPWRTVEFAATLEWLRAYNRDREPHERVHIYGFDIQQPWVTLGYLRYELAVLENVELTLRNGAFDRLAVPPAEYQQYDEQLRARISDALAELDEQLRSSPEPIDPLLLRIAETLAQVEQHYRTDHAGVSPPREQAMADNIRWLAETLSPSAPIMVWAHNGHVSRKPLHRSHTDAMGGHLAKQLGDGFVNVGFLFSRGDFLARARDQPKNPISTFSLPDGPTEGLGQRLASGGMPIFTLDLRTAPADSLRSWLSEPRKAWMVGSVVSEPQKQVGELELLVSFDVIVFVEEVTAAELVAEAR